MAQRAQSRRVGTKGNSLLGFLTNKKVTYHRDVASERKKLRAGELEDRKHRLALKKLQAEELAADRKIQAAEKQITAAEKKVDKGGMAEAQFEAIKARMQKEIEAQERFKAAAQKKVNPTWGFGIYQGSGFGVRQVAHFTSKAAAETYARSHGLKDYSIKRAFPKNENPGEAFSGRTPAKDGYRTGFTIGQRDKQDNRSTYSGERDRLLGILREYWHIGRRELDSYSHGLMKGYRAGYTAKQRKKPNPHKDWGFGVFAQDTRSAFQSRDQVAWFKTAREAKAFADAHNNALKASNEWFSQAKPHYHVRKKGKKGKRNPAADAQALSKAFHGRPATTSKRISEPMKQHGHLTELGVLVRLVIDTVTGKVVVLNFNTTDPRKQVILATSERDPKTGKLIGKQLYLRGGDQEVNLAGLKMDSPLWIRDKMELGRLHEFKRGDPPLMVGDEQVKGSITYRTRKGMDDFKLIDYWHRAGEETNRKYGPAARALVLYDYPNKKLEFGGGQYAVSSPGILN